MRFLTQLRHAYKVLINLTNSTYPQKNALNYASIAIAGNQKRCFASKTSGGEPNGDEEYPEAFAVLSLIRDNSRQVELSSQLKTDSDKEHSTAESLIIAKDNEGLTKNILYEIQTEITPQNPDNSLAVNSTTENPISGIDTEMTNLKKSLLNPSNLLKLGNPNDSSLSLSTNTRLEPYDTTTIPLHLNTLINGILEIDSQKTLRLQSPKVPEFNEHLTSMAANLCSATLDSGCRKYYSTENTLDANPNQNLGDTKNDKAKKVDDDLLGNYDEFKNEIHALTTSSTVAGKETKNTKRDPHIVCVGDEKKGCVSAGNKGNAPYIPIKATEPGKIRDTKGVSRSLGLLDPLLYKKSLKEAETKRNELAKASASRKERSSQRACQSKQSMKGSAIKDPCKSTASKCRQEMDSVKNFESLTEPSSPLKYGSKKIESKCESKELVSKNPSPKGLSKCTSEPKPSGVFLKDESKDPCKMPQSAKQENPCQPSLSKSKCSSKQNLPKCESEKPKPKEPCNALPKTVDSPEKKTHAESFSKAQDTKWAICQESQKVTEVSKCSPKSEQTPETSLKCGSRSELKLENPCKIRPIKTSKSCCSSSDTEDPCKVPPITFNKSPEKSSSTTKCSAPSKPKCEPSKEEKSSSCAAILSKPASDFKRSAPTKQDCGSEKEQSFPSSKCLSKIDSCKTPSESNVSKCSSKCSSGSSCAESQKQPLEADSEKACKRAGMDAKASCDSEPKNPCKSKCDSMTKPKPKCGKPPKGDTRPRCKKDSKCGSNKPSSCESKKEAESKCGTEMKTPEEPSKCGSKTCVPSPKPSKTEIKPKSTSSSGHTRAIAAPSSEPPKRKLHSLSNFAISNLIFSRNFSNDCPDKPKGGYKLESEKSDEYRRETCDNFSWKDTKSRKKRINKPKNCYPEETQEFCPDTACYKVYADTSGKSDKKKSKKRPKANKMEKNQALCTKIIFDHQKRHLSSKSIENEEALIQKPHSICTRGLTLPDISDNDALICVDSIALSDTDIHMFETGGRHTPELTLGNEAAGVVTEVGRSICNLKPGDHVVLESGIPCFKCELCKMGRYNLCNKISFKGFLKNHCIHPATFCHKICPPIPLEHAALIPQLALGCNACYEAGIKPNSNVAIIGSCAKTVCAAICAISMGTENVCVMCGMPETQILIQQYITEKVNCFDSNTIEIGIVRMILASLGTLPDIVINFSASTKTMNAAIMALKPAGVCTIAGFLSECVSYNIMEALMKEIRIIPSFRSKNMFPKAIHLLESGRAPLDCLIANCEVCKWNELDCAFKLALSEGNNGPRKAIVKCQLRD